MRTPIAFATFLGLGAVAMGVGAVPQVMKGSDTLFDILTDGSGVLLNCVVNGTPLSTSPASGTSLINYTGTGSGNGENEMEQVATPGQHVAPMSSFLSKNGATNNICNVKETGTTNATAEGINFALDGIVIAAAKTSGANSACTGTTGITAACDAAGGDVNKGLAFTSVVHDTAKIVPGPNMVVNSVRRGDDVVVGSTQSNTTGGVLRPGIERILPGADGIFQTTLAGDDVLLPEVTYTFTDWKDVLKVIYGGVDTVANAKSCASAIRHAVVDTYSNVFQTGCSTSATTATGTTATNGNGCRPKTCTGAVDGACSSTGDGPAELRHALRRDDASGTTDTFVSLLGLTKPKGVNDAACFNNFCNGFTGTFPTEDLRADTEVLADTGGPNANKGGAYDWDYQDYDPIRRRCMDSDSVCDRRGTLGVVLAMVPTDFLTKSQAFALTADTNGKLIPGTANAAMLGSSQVSAPSVFHACSATSATNLIEGRCPNGATQQTGCQWPNTGDAPGVGVSFANFAANYNGKSNVPTEAPTDDILFVGWQVGNADGRVYNRFARPLSNVDPRPLLTDTKKIGNLFRKITGANYRLHAAVEGLGNSQELPATGGTALCVERDATSQIGCLVANDACSIGFAGRGTLTSTALIDPIRLNQQAPSDDCIQRLLGGTPTTAYKLSRRLFLNTVAGFESVKVNTNELALAQCMSNPTMMRPIITGHDFVPNGAAGSDGPVCYDYNPLPAAQCGTANADNACIGNAAVPLVAACPNCRTLPDSTGFALP